MAINSRLFKKIRAEKAAKRRLNDLNQQRHDELVPINAEIESLRAEYARLDGPSIKQRIDRVLALLGERDRAVEEKRLQSLWIRPEKTEVVHHVYTDINRYVRSPKGYGLDRENRAEREWELRAAHVQGVDVPDHLIPQNRDGSYQVHNGSITRVHYRMVESSTPEQILAWYRNITRLLRRGELAAFATSLEKRYWRVIARRTDTPDLRAEQSAARAHAAEIDRSAALRGQDGPGLRNKRPDLAKNAAENALHTRLTERTATRTVTLPPTEETWRVALAPRPGTWVILRAKERSVTSAQRVLQGRPAYAAGSLGKTHTVEQVVTGACPEALYEPYGLAVGDIVVEKNSMTAYECTLSGWEQVS